MVSVPILSRLVLVLFELCPGEVVKHLREKVQGGPTVDELGAFLVKQRPQSLNVEFVLKAINSALAEDSSSPCLEALSNFASKIVFAGIDNCL